jgi:hypothetical protein
VIARVIGKALRGIRAGDKHLAWNDTALTTVPVRICLISPAFEDDRAVPIRYAGKGLTRRLPSSAGSMRLMMVGAAMSSERPDTPESAVRH